MTITKDIRTNLDPKIWGSNGWFFIESVCLSYPTEPTEHDKQQFKNFLYSLSFVLPCTKCRIHFNEYITKYPLNNRILNSKDNLIIWILGAHNNVNKINNSRIFKLKEFYSYYNNKYQMDVQKDTCTTTCGLKNNNTNDITNDITNDNTNDNSTKLQLYKFIPIILFGMIITLGLYLSRQYQLKNLELI